MDATIGHNNPPPFDPDQHAAYVAQADEFIEATQKWLDLPEIASEDEASALTDQISGLRALFKQVDGARKDAKQPHLAASRAVDDAFKGITTKIETAANMLKKKLQPYLDRKAQFEAEQKRKQEEEARKAREAAEKAAREAEESNSLAAKFAAEEAAKAAEEAEKEAKRRADVNVKSATGAGRTMSLRTTRRAEITNIRTLFLHYQDRPEVREVLERLANADIRSKDVDESKIPGINIIEEKAVA